VLLLSVAVTGINVGFSYVGNFFTNALVKKQQDAAYLFVGVYFVGFLVAIPIVAYYGYVQDFLGLRWREWLTNDLIGRYFQRRAYYEIESERVIDNPDQRIHPNHLGIFVDYFRRGDGSSLLCRDFMVKIKPAGYGCSRLLHHWIGAHHLDWAALN
jgi:ABC-type uncharacterized transport system fused permease/ATPase subunit